MNGPPPPDQPVLPTPPPPGLLGHLPCGLGAARLDGSFLWGNPRLCALLECPDADALRATRLQAHLTVASRVLFETHLRPTLHVEGEVREVFLELKRANRGRVPVLCSAQRVPDGSVALALFEIARRNNLEAQLLQARQEAERANAALTEERQIREAFVATLSHDLLSPISAGRLSAQNMLRAAQTERMQRGARRIVKTLDRAAAMIGDLLTANRLQAGEPLKLALEPGDLAQVVRPLIDDINELHPGRVHYEGPDALPCACHADSLRRVVDNLVSNAIKYGDPDKAVTVRLIEAPAEARLRLEVHNWGAPIAAQDQAQIFVPYQRTADAQASRKKGWGLGLALVQGVAEAHGGQAQVRSSAQAGTTFWLDLPAADRSP